MLQVLLAEDHTLVRDGIRMLLETDKSINIVGEATNGKEVLEYFAKGKKVDVVLTDINMPELDGISLLKMLKEISPETFVVMLSVHDNEKYIVQSFTEGAAGYLVKNVSADELIFSLKYVSAGGKYLCAELAMRLLDKLIHGQGSVGGFQSKVEFSVRETEVLQLIAEGFTNSEMSDKLFISKRTIEGHRQSLIDKTGSRNTAALIRYSVLNGLVS